MTKRTTLVILVTLLASLIWTAEPIAAKKGNGNGPGSGDKEAKDTGGPVGGK